MHSSENRNDISPHGHSFPGTAAQHAQAWPHLSLLPASSAWSCPCPPLPVADSNQQQASFCPHHSEVCPPPFFLLPPLPLPPPLFPPPFAFSLLPAVLASVSVVDLFLFLQERTPYEGRSRLGRSWVWHSRKRSEELAQYLLSESVLFSGVSGRGNKWPGDAFYSWNFGLSSHKVGGCVSCGPLLAFLGWVL